jgi:GntR family transcriptional repressor for pyruvate dehydrogenase complex
MPIATRGKTSAKAARPRDQQEQATGLVVEHVRRLIESGEIKPGDRLPPERDLALEMGVSRPTLRSGLQALATMGVVVSRQGAGTFLADGPPRLGNDPLRFLAALHGFTRDEMFEARRVLEAASAGLSAGRATPDQMAAMAEEVTEMFAALEDPQQYLVHDIRFHRAVAAGSGNPVLATLIDTVAELVYETRRLTVERARDLRQSAEMHRRIYRAIRARDPETAQREMNAHLDLARQAQASEEDAPRPPQDAPGI